MVTGKRQLVDVAGIMVMPDSFSMSRTRFMSTIISPTGTAGQASSGTRAGEKGYSSSRRIAGQWGREGSL